MKHIGFVCDHGLDGMVNGRIGAETLAVSKSSIGSQTKPVYVIQDESLADAWEIYYKNDDQLYTITKDRKVVERCMRMAYYVKPLFYGVATEESANSDPALKVTSDAVAIAQFAIAMKEKMELAGEMNGRFGWEDPTLLTDSNLLHHLALAVEKGDPIDIANYAMMMYSRKIEHVALRAVCNQYNAFNTTNYLLLSEVTLSILGAAVNIPDGMYARAKHLANIGVANAKSCEEVTGYQIQAIDSNGVIRRQTYSHVPFDPNMRDAKDWSGGHRVESHPLYLGFNSAEFDRLRKQLEHWETIGCDTCDGSGHVHRIDGEYLGSCHMCNAYTLNTLKNQLHAVKADFEQFMNAADLIKTSIAGIIDGNVIGAESQLLKSV